MEGMGTNSEEKREYNEKPRDEKREGEKREEKKTCEFVE
jgi:hypothetical protein